MRCDRAINVCNAWIVTHRVIDADYRGNVGVVLFNHSETDFHVNVGDRVAQLILESIKRLPVVEVSNLEDTQRGAGAYGSTGVAAVASAEMPAAKVAKASDAPDVKSTSTQP